MGRRLFFILGLASAVYGGWVVHHEVGLNNFCNAQLVSPKQGFVFSPQCLNIVWPYSEGFALLIIGAVLVVGTLVWPRRTMAGERQYLKDLRAGKFSRANDHLNSYNFPARTPEHGSNTQSRDQWRDSPEGP